MSKIHKITSMQQRHGKHMEVNSKCTAVITCETRYGEKMEDVYTTCNAFCLVLFFMPSCMS